MTAHDPRADALRAGYAPVAAAYHEHLGHELDGKPLDRAFLGAFVERTRDGLVADIGCGPGHITQYLAARGARTEGVDLSPAMIAHARATYPELSFREADMFALPYADASLAGVVAFYAIVHLRTEELAAPLREMHRVLAPGGVLALAFHIGVDAVHVDVLFGVPTSLDFFMHRPEDVIAALQDAGFTLEARLDREPYPDAEHPTKRSYLLARR